jgi:hypothetical protein
LDERRTTSAGHDDLILKIPIGSHTYGRRSEL